MPYHLTTTVFHKGDALNKAEDERINAILREHERVHAAVKAQYEQHKDEVWTGTQWVPKPAKPFNPVLSVTTKVTDDE